MSIERDRINRVPSQENAIGTTHNSLAFALPTIRELVSSREPILPPKSPLTGLPDLQRFPDTFGYPAIWGGSGKDEQQLDETPEPEPSRFDNMTDDQLQEWTDTWTKPTQSLALLSFLSSVEERRELARILRDEMETDTIERAEAVLSDSEHEPMTLEKLNAWVESLRPLEELGIQLPPLVTQDELTEMAKQRANEPPKDVGLIDDFYTWQLEMLACADDVRERVIRSLPEYRNLPDDAFHREMGTRQEARRKQKEENRRKFSDG